MNNASPTSYFSGHRLMGQVGVLTVANVVARLVSAVGLILIARLLGPEEYGPVIASFAFARILAVFFNLGLDAWLLREGGGQDAIALGEKSGALFIIKGGMGAIWLGLVWLIAPWLNQESFPMGLVIWCALGVWLEDLAVTASSAFQAALQLHKAAIVTVALQSLLLLITLGMMSLGINEAKTLIWGRAMMASVAMVGSIWWLRRTFPLRFIGKEVWGALRGSRSFALSLGLAMLARQADVWIVANWLGKEATGLYGPAVTLSSTVLLLALSIHNILLPTFSQMYQHNRAQLPYLTGYLTRIALGIGGVLWFVIWLTANWGVTFLYGTEYSLAGDILRILGLVIWTGCLKAVFGAFLASVRWQRYRVLVQTIVVFIAVGLDIFAVTQTDWGIIGIAWIYVASEIMLMAGYGLYVWHWIKQATKNIG